MKETSETEIRKSANRIFSQIKLNVEKIQNTNEKYLAPRFMAVLERMKEYLIITEKEKRPNKATIIYMSDKKAHYGGFCDKLNRIVFLFTASKQLDCDFKIYCDTPFNLPQYLVPNETDWLIDERNIVYDKNKTVAVFSVDFECEIPEISGIETKITPPSQQNFIETINGLADKYEQILCYFHFPVNNVNFQVPYRRLFMPSQNLQNMIAQNLEKTGADFVAAHFRFQKLLGDFSDCNLPDFVVLDERQKNILIERCLNVLSEISRQNDGFKILVCSDSASFLKSAKKLDFVFVVSGCENRIIHTHIDDYRSVGKDAAQKLFTDLFLMSRAKKIYSVVEDKMYAYSSFARTAALINNVEFYKAINGKFERML